MLEREGRAVLMDDAFHVMACVLWLCVGCGWLMEGCVVEVGMGESIPGFYQNI